MTERGKVFGILGAVALAAWYFLTRKSSAMLGPLVPVTTMPGAANPATTTPLPDTGPNGNASGAPAPSLVALCEAAPLNSFGSACEGITWLRDASGQPTDLRRAPSSVLIDIVPPVDRGPVTLASDAGGTRFV